MDGLASDIMPLSIAGDQHLFYMDSSESDTYSAKRMDLDSARLWNYIMIWIMTPAHF